MKSNIKLFIILSFTLLAACKNTFSPEKPVNDDSEPPVLPASCVVHFEANDGAPAPVDQLIDIGGKAVEPGFIHKPDSGFAGWFTGESVEWDFENDEVTDDLALYANWSGDFHIVSFNSNGGTPGPGLINIADGARIPRPPVVINGELGFAGWFSDNGTFYDEWDFGTGRVDADITLYAKWIFPVYTITSNADSGPGSLRQTLSSAPAGSTIVIESDVEIIALKSRLTANKNVTIEGNGVTITRDASWISADTASQLFSASSATAAVTIRRVHFKDGLSASYGAAINNSANLTLESCIFSGNHTDTMAAFGGAVYNTKIMTVKACTFYGNNAGYAGGAIYNNNGEITLEGNLFYANIDSRGYGVVYNNGGTVLSSGYNVADLPFGTEANQCGWEGTASDRALSSQTIGPATFRPLSGRAALNIIDTPSYGYPDLDFYGDSITNGAAAGAVQAEARGYLFDITVNNNPVSSVSIEPPPERNLDGLLDGECLYTLTVNPEENYEFVYWQVNEADVYTSDQLHLTLTSHTKVIAVFERITNDEYKKYVKKVNFTDSTATVNFSGLSNNNVYLVKVNRSDRLVIAPNTGGVYGSYPVPKSLLSSVMPDEILPGMDLAEASEFNANPPPPPVRKGQGVPRTAFGSNIVDVTTRDFWALGRKKPATLRAQGTYSNIWVLDENFGSVAEGSVITSEQAETLAEKFDIVYPAETNLLGYEYGGGLEPGDPEYGGVDGDPRIQILVQNGSAAGYFQSKDHYPQSQVYDSNEAEMFYLDASNLNRVPDYVHSAMIHEFQHMINFNMKFLKNGVKSDSWYDEMLAMMAEELLASYAGLDPANRYNRTNQGKNFIFIYDQYGITDWDGLNSYATVCGFGKYLLRNYGGAYLLKSILGNNKTNIESINQALDEFSAGLTFKEALARYGEAMIFSGTKKPDGVHSFDKTFTSEIGEYSYTVYGFNIWDSSVFGQSGPKIFDFSQKDMRPYSIVIHSTSEWKGKSGSFSVTLEKPGDPNIEFYLLAR